MCENTSRIEEIFDLADKYKLSEETHNDHIAARYGTSSSYTNKSHFAADFDIKAGIDRIKF